MKNYELKTLWENFVKDYQKLFPHNENEEEVKMNV